MKVLVLAAVGTRGDVQPYVGLARALHAAGHEPVVVAPSCYAHLATEHGVDVIAVDDRWNRLTEDPEIRTALETNCRGLRGKRAALRMMHRAKALLQTVWEEIAAAVPNDVDVVVHPAGMPGQHVAEWLAVPAVSVLLQPLWVPTAAFPCPLWAPRWWPKRLNRASYPPAGLVQRAMIGPAVTRWRRRTLRLPRRFDQHNPLRTPHGTPAPVLHAFSRHIPPAAPDWPEHVHTTGFWFLPTAGENTPPSRLVEFLEAGSRPVYIGFGSMTGRNPRQSGQLVIESVRRAGVRAILATGSGGIDTAELSKDVLVLDDAQHDWIFPQVSAVVHHAGAGTTGAALAAGRPQVLCPFVGDQPFWARRMRSLGVAPSPLPQRELTVANLAAAIRHASTDTAMAARAASLGSRVRAEGGAAEAVHMLENLVAQRSPLARSGQTPL